MPSLCSCFGAGGDEDRLRGEPPARRRRASNTSTHGAKIPVSEVPGSQKAPIHKTDKSLPQRPQTHSRTFELPGSSPDSYDMPTALPDTHPLARPATFTSSNSPRPSQQSDRHAYSPYPASGGSTYRPSGSVRSAPSEQDADAITPVNSATSPAGYYPRGNGPNMYQHMTDALTDRKRMFERLRRANGVELVGGGGGGNGNGSAARMVTSTPPMDQVLGGAVTAVEMEAPPDQQQRLQRQQQLGPPAEMATEGHVRKPSGPKELA